MMTMKIKAENEALYKKKVMISRADLGGSRLMDESLVDRDVIPLQEDVEAVSSYNVHVSGGRKMKEISYYINKA